MRLEIKAPLKTVIRVAWVGGRGWYVELPSWNAKKLGNSHVRGIVDGTRASRLAADSPYGESSNGFFCTKGCPRHVHPLTAMKVECAGRANCADPRRDSSRTVPSRVRTARASISHFQTPPFQDRAEIKVSILPRGRAELRMGRRRNPTADAACAPEDGRTRGSVKPVSAGTPDRFESGKRNLQNVREGFAV